MSLPGRDETFNISDIPQLLDFDIYQTANFEWKGQLTYTNEAGVTVNVDLSDATTAKIFFEMGTGVDASFDLADCDDQGYFTIALTADQSDSLAAGMQQYNVKIVLPAGNATFPAGISLIIFRGIARIHVEVSAA